MGETGEGTLRAKYLDWCSARLAERFLDLSPEEIYALARPDAPEPGEPEVEARPGSRSKPGPEPGPEAAAASRPDPGSAADSTAEAAPDPGGPSMRPDESSRPGAVPQLPHPTEEGYRTLVQRVTEQLLRRTSLPTFEQWSEAYAESPERFDAELLGFWKDVVSGSGPETGEGEGGPAES